jgi:putative DNA primase/helicase
MKRNGEQISNDIARLRGTMFVTTTEAEQGKRLSEPLIKQITGNDRMTARFLYGEFFDFVPTFKVFMATNHIASRKLVKGGNR